MTSVLQEILCGGRLVFGDEASTQKIHRDYRYLSGLVTSDLEARIADSGEEIIGTRRVEVIAHRSHLEEHGRLGWCFDNEF